MKNSSLKNDMTTRMLQKRMLYGPLFSQKRQAMLTTIENKTNPSA